MNDRFAGKVVVITGASMGGGAIVNVASLSGIAPLPGAATCTATKFALRGFSFALAEEVRDRNISVSLVSPGPVDTGFLMDHLEEGRGSLVLAADEHGRAGGGGPWSARRPARAAKSRCDA